MVVFLKFSMHIGITGISHWSPPKPIPHLVFFPSSSLLPMTGTNCKNLWSWRLTSPSLALSTSCQSRLQITAPVHSPSVNSPSIYLPHPHTVFIYLFILLLCTPVSLLAHSSSAHLPFQCFNCYIVITSPPWPISCLNSLILPHLHSLYIDFLFSFVLLYYWLSVLFIPCVTLCCCMCRIANALSWPGRN